MQWLQGKQGVLWRTVSGSECSGLCVHGQEAALPMYRTAGIASVLYWSLLCRGAYCDHAVLYCAS